MTTALITPRGTTVATPQTIASMALTHDPIEIADRLGISEDTVIRTLSGMGKLARRRLFAVCAKTGRRVASYSARGVYIKAQIAGFTDYSIVAEDDTQAAPMSVIKPAPTTGFRHKVGHRSIRVDPGPLVQLVKSGASVETIAENLGITKSAAKKRIQTAQRRGLLTKRKDA